MAMRQDDWVVHSQHGVGRVVAVEAKEFEQGVRKMYFRIAIEGGTVWVPVEGSLRELRRLAGRRELGECRALLKGRPVPLAKGYRELREALRARLENSSLRVRCEIVRDLTAATWKKGLSESSAVTLKMTRREVCSEWAAAGGVSLAEAGKEIEALLLEGRRAHEGGA
jgi:RNA polymerase-interacting CarD/CdnL/TRCF family regulator